MIRANTYTSRRGKSFMIVNNSIIYCDNKTSVVSDYNDYIVSLLKRFIENTNASININFVVFGNECTDFGNNNLTIRIECNYEHTLVLPDGRDTCDAVQGKLYDSEGKRMDYLARLVNHTELAKSDIIIDYSFPNVAHIGMSGEFRNIYNKMTWIYPSLYEENELCKSTHRRMIDCLTTFYDINQPRRKKISDELKLLSKMDEYHSKYYYTNHDDCFDKNKLQNLYFKTRILVNIHQTDHHHTLEELRILPALQCGVLVICEKTPINENKFLNVEYDDYIIWATYDEIVQKTIEVIENYEKYFHDIFLQPKKVNLYDFDAQNYRQLEMRLSKFTNTHGVHQTVLEI